MGNTYSQIFPPAPTLTEANLGSQKGKVFLVTGGYKGVGFELSKILFNAGAKVYIAGRSRDVARRALIDIKAAAAPDAGEVEFLHVDVSDLESVRTAADVFRSKESRLDVLWQNAGISSPPAGSTSKQGHELQMATNVLGPFLLYQLLAPCLEEAAKGAPAASVRVVWTASIAVDHHRTRGGFTMAQIDKPGRNLLQQLDAYAISKTANWFLADVLAKQPGGTAKGILHLAQNPGNLRSELLRHRGLMDYLTWPLRYEPRYGAYTELWAGLSRELGSEDAGVYIEPWGRRHPGNRQDLLDSLKSKADGGTGLAEEFLAWCWDQTKEYRE